MFKRDPVFPGSNDLYNLKQKDVLPCNWDHHKAERPSSVEPCFGCFLLLQEKRLVFHDVCCWKWCVCVVIFSQ